MNILYIGAGFVGACSAAVSAANGHTVLVYDIDQKKIDMLNSRNPGTIEACLFEQGLGALLVQYQSSIQFTTDYHKMEEFLNGCDGVFMCLPTPEIRETGQSDLTFYESALETLSAALLARNGGAQEKYVVLINKSTVPIGMARKVEQVLTSKGVKNYGIASNPEFLVGGKAVEGSLKPDRVVVGANNQKDFEIVRGIYHRFFGSTHTQYIEVTTTEAEAGKLMANFCLFQKVVMCFDVVGRTCEAFPDIRFEQMRQILTSDKRIGDWGFFDSIYAGGSCLIKDTRSLTHQLQAVGTNTDLIEQVYLGNERQLESFLSRFESETGQSWVGKKVALFGLAFKKDTNDVRNSASLKIASFLKEKAVAKLYLHDPVAISEFKKFFPEDKILSYVVEEAEAVREAEVVIIATDWPQYQTVADLFSADASSRLIIMDGRRMLVRAYDELQNKGYTIIAVGSPVMKGKI